MALLGIPYTFLLIGQLLLPKGGVVIVGNTMWAGLAGIYVGSLFLLFAIPAAIFAISKGTEFLESLRQGLRLFFPLLWCFILLELIVVGGLIMLIIPGIMMTVWFFAGFFTLVIEDKRGLNALLQSREYVRGYWWAIFGRLLAMVATVSIPTLLFQGLISLVLGHTAGMVAYYALTVLTAPFGLAYVYTLYKNLTVLKPSLPATTPTSGRKFLITSAILGLLLPILGLISAFSLGAIHRAQELGRAAQLQLEASSATTTAPYINIEYGFSITPPKGWQTNQTPKAGIVSFLNRNTPENDMPYILVHLIPRNNLSFAEYANTLVTQMKNEPSVSVLSSSQVSCDTTVCHLVEDTVTSSATSTTHQLILLKQAREGSFFVLVGQSADSAWSTYAADIRNSLLSFSTSDPFAVPNQPTASSVYDIVDLGVKFTVPATFSDLTHRVVKLAGDQAVNSVAFSSRQLEAAGCGVEALGYLTYDTNKGGVIVGRARGSDLYYLQPKAACKTGATLQNWQGLRDALKTLGSD
jgi:hypothetical protein